ncbi:hypothetical protein [Roseateles sp.]|uniref:hypothetical protein n=1 Tax=Roseateles sp. TaxID=1971397 RepID=UPI0031E03361
MNSWRRPLGALFIAAALALWACPALDFFAEPQVAPNDQFQMLAFPRCPCGGSKCLSRAVNVSLAEWNSGILTVVQSNADLIFPRDSFTLVPPADAKEMIAQWRATLEHQGYDGGEFRATRREGDWQLELVMRDGTHSRSNLFEYVLKADGNVLPERSIEYSWVDLLFRGVIAAGLMLVGAFLLWRRVKPEK